MATMMPDSAAGDFSQGYSVEISVLPDGTYKLTGPEPLAEEATEETGEAGSEMGEDFDSIGGALKALLAIVKANPVGESGDAQMQAGFSAQ